MRLRDHKKSLSQHLLGAVDLALDFATLGEYGLEPVTAVPRAPRRPGQPEAPGARTRGCERERAASRAALSN